MKIAVIGAGRIGGNLARHLSVVGHEVFLANRSGGEALAQLAASLGAQAFSAKEAAKRAEVIVIALPISAFGDLPVAEFGSKIVLDTCNYYPNRDGIIGPLETGTTTTGEMLAALLPKAKIVKAFNSILADDLASKGRQLAQGVHALPIASDHSDALEIAADLVRDIGLDPLPLQPLAENWRFERARPAYCQALPLEALKEKLAATKRSDFVAEGSWRQKG